MDVAEAHGDLAVRPVGGELELDHRSAEYLEARGERCGIEDRRFRVLLALVTRFVRRAAMRTPYAGTEAYGLRRGDDQRPRGGGAIGEAVFGQEEAALLDA